MWPWGHLVVGYVFYSLLAYLRSWRIDGYVVFVVALGTQLPDLIDKPLAWAFGVLPSGRSLAHSLIIAILVVVLVIVYYHQRNRPLLGVGFGVGYLSHLVADGAYYLPSKQYEYYSYLFWPFVSQPSYSTEPSFVAHFLSIDPGPYFLLQFGLVGATFGLWLWQSTPGISLGTAKLRGKKPRTSDVPLRTVKEKANPDVGEFDTKAIRRPSSAGCEQLITGTRGKAPTLSVVIPTLNEQESIENCLEEIKAATAELEILTEIIVADNSTDGTAEIARDRGAIVVTPDDIGYGYACRYAFEYARGEYVAVCNAGGTYDFEELTDLLEAAFSSDADFILGTRFNGLIRLGAMSPFGYFWNSVLRAGLWVFYRLQLTDVRSGFRVIRRDCLNGLDLRANGTEFSSELLLEATGHGLTIIEVPVSYYKSAGKARLDSFQEGWHHVRFMLMNAPGYLFLFPGAVFGFLGVMLLPLSLLNSSVGAISFGRHFLSVSSVLIIIGYQLLALAMFARRIGNSMRMPADPVTGWLVEAVQLRHVASAGALMITASSIYALYVLSRWVAGENGMFPVLVLDIVAGTFMILGVQMVVSSMMISMVDNTD
jgi:glycosyltransferase involved in cell wall biosynthesis